MIVKGIIDEDLINYKKPSMVVMTPICTFKCDKECGGRVCQNSALATSPNIEVHPKGLIRRYIDNPITQAIIFAGLEPLDTFVDVFECGYLLRQNGYMDDIVIFTGYTEEEVANMYVGIPPGAQDSYIDLIKQHLAPVVVKYGRFVPDCQPHYDEVLGVNLSSDNQYAKRYDSEIKDN